MVALTTAAKNIKPPDDNLHDAVFRLKKAITRICRNRKRPEISIGQQMVTAKKDRRDGFQNTGFNYIIDFQDLNNHTNVPVTNSELGR